MHLNFSPYLFFGVSIIGLLGCEVLYFRLAQKFGILDKPNIRSSHSQPVIRGGGIILIPAVLSGQVFFEFPDPFFLTGFVIISIISFMDDVREQQASLRSSLQALAVLLLLYQVNFFQNPVWLLAVAFVFILGAVNAFNFMDGINGITGIYAFVNLGTLYGLHLYGFEVVSTEFYLVVIAAVVVFLWFNFRKHARCFAGDVGSVGLAFIQIFLVMRYIDLTSNYAWVLMFTVFGVDSIITIVYRISRKENIFKAHRSHLYQYMANELGMPHRLVSLSYGFVQFVINVAMVWFVGSSEFVLIFAVLGITVSAYLICRYMVFLSLRKKASL